MKVDDYSRTTAENIYAVAMTNRVNSRRRHPRRPHLYRKCFWRQGRETDLTLIPTAVFSGRKSAPLLTEAQLASPTPDRYLQNQLPPYRHAVGRRTDADEAGGGWRIHRSGLPHLWPRCGRNGPAPRHFHQARRQKSDFDMAVHPPIRRTGHLARQMGGENQPRHAVQASNPAILRLQPRVG